MGSPALFIVVFVSMHMSPTSCFQVSPTLGHVTFKVCPDKAAKWIVDLRAALEAGQLDAGAAQKLAGRLTWSTQMLFYKVGRAMIKPVYAQKRSPTGAIGPRLKEALQWWLNALSTE